MAVQEAGTALDDFDGALQQVSASGDQAIQDRVTALQAQSQQVRQQFQNDPQQAAYGMEALAQAAMGLQTASLPAEADAIVGRTVVTLDGEEAGEVANLLVTPDGRVSGLVLRRSGALGLGGTQFAVTWDQISIEGVQYVVNMTRDQLENLPEYRTE
jgi:sporulation protein YlmC with PRC-barrel domain